MLTPEAVSAVTQAQSAVLLLNQEARYINNLAAYRCDDGRCEGADEKASALQGCISDWAEYFANAILLACGRAQGFEHRIADIQEEWRGRGTIRKNSSAGGLIAHCARVFGPEEARVSRREGDVTPTHANSRSLNQ